MIVDRLEMKSYRYGAISIVRQVGRLLQFERFLKFPVCEYKAPLHFFSSEAAAQSWPGPHSRCFQITHDDAPQSVGLP